jgi:predicted ATPase
VRALAAEQGFAYWATQGTILQGWALATQGHKEAGIAQMRQGLADRQATGTELARPYFLGLLAEAYGQAGQVGEGLAVLAEALTAVDHTGERLYEAELQRLTGAFLLKQAVADEPQAEACFHQALAVARHQQAKSLELRATVSLSRLWQCQGQCHAARMLLAPIYGWFTEGFDTPDLQEAKALLEELGA